MGLVDLPRPPPRPPPRRARLVERVWRPQPLFECLCRSKGGEEGGKDGALEEKEEEGEGFMSVSLARSLSVYVCVWACGRVGCSCSKRAPRRLPVCVEGCMFVRVCISRCCVYLSTYIFIYISISI